MMRLTVGIKINALIIFLLLVSLGGAIFFSTQLFTEDLSGYIRKSTLDTTSMFAGRIRSDMKSLADRARTLGAAALEQFRYPEDRIRFIQENLSSDPSLFAISLYDPRPVWRIIRPDAKKSGLLNDREFARLDQTAPPDTSLIVQGKVTFKAATLSDQTPLVRLSMPLVQRSNGTFSQFLTIEINQNRLSNLFSQSSIHTSSLVDGKGMILASSDPKTFPVGSTYQSALTQDALTLKHTSRQMDFRDNQNRDQIGAYEQVGFGDLFIVSQIPREAALQVQKKVFRRTLLLAGTFLFLSLALGYLFSQSLTKPIKSLSEAAQLVRDGNFEVQLDHKANTKGDEIHKLTGVFNEMVHGLKERENLKTAFHKFHNKEIAEKLLSGELNLGGERKNAFVFFSDVRGFTSMSEKMDPENLVHILNLYMTRMVNVIFNHGGVVDKFVGDAIMAVWGIPMEKPGDGDRAVKACLEMRVQLNELNQEFTAKGLPTLQIGMGLNFGPLIAGNIGSEQRMEYTVIGDTVNTASRVESLTKTLGTDLLVTQTVINQLKDKFIFERAAEKRVKGKADSLVVYNVLGTIDANGQEHRIQTPYSTYAAEKSDKVQDSASPPLQPTEVAERHPPIRGLPVPPPFSSRPKNMPPYPNLTPKASPAPVFLDETKSELLPEEHSASIDLKNYFNRAA